MEKVNLAEKLALFSEQWKPKIVGELNGQQVKLVKFQGPFVLAPPRPRGRTLPGRQGPVSHGVPGSARLA